MRRILLRVFAILAAGALLFIPLLAGLVPTSQSSSPDPVRITQYDAVYRVAKDGTLHGKETLVGDFPYGRHGIFRYWDLKDFGDEHVRLKPTHIKITRDGQDEPKDMLWESGRRFRVAKVGDAEVTLNPGKHTYVITYQIRGALAPASVTAGTSSSWSVKGSKRSVFNWQVVAGGWAMAMDHAKVRVVLPAASGEAQCAIRDGRPCKVAGVGTKALTITARDLPPYTPVTVRADVPVPTPERPSVPWDIGYDRLLGRSEAAATVVVIIGALALIIGYGWDRRSRERQPGYPVMYEPPAGLGPVQTAFVTSEQVPRRALTATLLYQAAQGLTKLTQEGDDWKIEGIGDEKAWAATDDVTRHVGQSLGVTTPGSTFEADGTVSAGSKLQSLKTSIGTVTDTWATAAGVQSPSSSERLGRTLVGLSALLAVVLTFFPLGSSLYVIPFAAFTVGAIGLLVPGVGRRRTLLGRDIWSKAGGFERLLSTDSAKDRFDFSGKKELYTAFIPFAVAFECADRWARKYEKATGQEAPTPMWYSGGTGSSHSSFFGGSGDSFSSFESSLSSSISAYAATQSSSSGGGGGGGVVAAAAAAAVAAVPGKPVLIHQRGETP